MDKNSAQRRMKGEKKTRKACVIKLPPSNAFSFPDLSCPWYHKNDPLPYLPCPRTPQTEKKKISHITSEEKLKPMVLDDRPCLKQSHHRSCTPQRLLSPSIPLSKSSSASTSRLITGPAAPGSSFVSKAACSWTSSSSSSRKRPWVTGGGGAEVEGVPEEELPPLWPSERTMSFLQIGQVRRRVVSHGVLLRR